VTVLVAIRHQLIATFARPRAAAVKDDLSIPLVYQQ